MSKVYQIESYGKTYDVELIPTSYAMTGDLAIQMVCENGEPFGMVTVNIGEIGEIYGYDCGFLDVNNIPWLEDFVVGNGLGEPIGVYSHSGFCEYPLYRFNMDMLRRA